MDLGLLPDKVVLEVTCVKAFAFQSSNTGLFEAQYKLQSLLFEIWFNKLPLGKKLLKFLYNTSFSGKVERVLFHPLLSCFLKENHF